jgi:RNA polymerase sigma-70 factor (ECF subfamily)
VDDQQLIARIRAGDPSAERALYDAHVDRLYRLVFRYVGEPDVAEDCVQDTFIRAFARIGDFRGESALGSWLGAIAVSMALTALRKRKRASGREAAWEDAEALPAPSATRLDPDLKSRLHEEIDQLPEGYRMVFLLHDVEGYTHEEIGTMLGVQPGTSKAQLSRARARLRQRLAAFTRN